MRHRKMVLSCAAHDKLQEYRPYFGDECLEQKNNVEVKIQKRKLANSDNLLTMVHSLWTT